MHRTAALSRVEQREQFVETLPLRHQARLPRYCRALQDMRDAILHNHQLICLLVEGAQSIFENVPSQELPLQHLPGDSGAPMPKPDDIEKVKTSLNNFHIIPPTSDVCYIFRWQHVTHILPVDALV